MHRSVSRPCENISRLLRCVMVEDKSPLLKYIGLGMPSCTFLVQNKLVENIWVRLSFLLISVVSFWGICTASLTWEKNSPIFEFKEKGLDKYSRVRRDRKIGPFLDFCCWFFIWRGSSIPPAHHNPCGHNCTAGTGLHLRIILKWCPLMGWRESFAGLWYNLSILSLRQKRSI